MLRLSANDIVAELARHRAKQITKRVIAQLQRMTECTLSGDDSVLKNVWDEVCVQKQVEESVSWDMYVKTMEGILEGEIESLTVYEREALWLQSEQGRDWDEDDEELREAYPVLADDIVEYLLREYVLEAARRWTNSRIRAYIERGYDMD